MNDVDDIINETSSENIFKEVKDSEFNDNIINKIENNLKKESEKLTDEIAATTAVLIDDAEKAAAKAAKNDSGKVAEEAFDELYEAPKVEGEELNFNKVEEPLFKNEEYQLFNNEDSFSGNFESELYAPKSYDEMTEELVETYPNSLSYESQYGDELMSSYNKLDEADPFENTFHQENDFYGIDNNEAFGSAIDDMVDGMF